MLNILSKFFLLEIIILLTLNFNSFSDSKIKTINIHQDNLIFETEYLLKNIPLKRNDYFSYSKIEESLNILKSLYFKECFYDVEIKLDSVMFTQDSLYCDLYFTVSAGRKYVIKKISITGNTNFTVDELLQLLQTKPEACLYKSVLEEDIENILSFYENNGFPWVSIKISNIVINDSDKTISLELEIDEKSRAQINTFKIEGNKTTRTSVIIRELRIKPGEIFNYKKVEKIPLILNKMQLFENVETPMLFISNNSDTSQTNEKLISTGILIKLTEGNPNYFDGLIGYLPGGLNEKGYFIGTVEISMRNLFGTARKLNFKWSKDEKFSQELGVKYTEPWLFDYPINLKGYFFQRKQDTTYIKRYGEIKSELMLSDAFSSGLSIGQENIINTNQTYTSQISNSGTFSLGLEVAYDTRDQIQNPKSGILLKSDYFYGKKKIYALSKSVALQKYGLDFEIYKQFLANQVFMIGIHGKYLNSPNIEISDMYRLGGTNTLRGYRENQFLGSRIFWSNLEYRFLLARRSFFYVFFDTGYYYRENQNTDEIYQAFKYGYGIGIRVRTGIGTIGISLALGKGDNLNQIKIHLGLINEF